MQKENRACAQGEVLSRCSLSLHGHGDERRPTSLVPGPLGANAARISPLGGLFRKPLGPVNRTTEVTSNTMFLIFAFLLQLKLSTDGTVASAARLFEDNRGKAAEMRLVQCSNLDFYLLYKISTNSCGFSFHTWRRKSFSSSIFAQL